MVSLKFIRQTLPEIILLYSKKYSLLGLCIVVAMYWGNIYQGLKVIKISGRLIIHKLEGRGCIFVSSSTLCSDVLAYGFNF